MCTLLQLEISDRRPTARRLSVDGLSGSRRCQLAVKHGIEAKYQDGEHGWVEFFSARRSSGAP